MCMLRGHPDTSAAFSTRNFPGLASVARLGIPWATFPDQGELIVQILYRH